MHPMVARPMWKVKREERNVYKAFVQAAYEITMTLVISRHFNKQEQIHQPPVAE